MSLQQKINDNLKNALRNKDKENLSILRMLNSAIKNEQIKNGKELSDNEIINVISKQAKQRQDSIEQYKVGNRNDLAEKEQKELDILKVYLPQQINQNELEKIIEETLAETNAQGPQDMGKVMSKLMPKIQGIADGKLASKLVSEKLKK